jgi:transcriptional regulator with XRE-family HTH domain
MLKKARNTSKMSQKKLAQKIGVTQPYISQLENRCKYNTRVTVDLVFKIAKELNIEPIDVLYYFRPKS